MLHHFSLFRIKVKNCKSKKLAFIRKLIHLPTNFPKHMRFFKKLFPLALMLSFAGTAFCQSKKSDIPKPPFSWDRVPVYQMFGDSKRLLNEEEVKQIGDTTSFLCIEKIHGRRTLGGAELGAAHEFKRFKKDSPKTSCLFYFNSAYAYPFTSATEKFAHGKVSPEYLPFLLLSLIHI